MPAPLPAPLPAIRLVAPAAALLLTALTGCTGGSSGPAATPSTASTPLESFDTTSLAVRRDAFCSGIGPTALEDALGTRDYRGSSYNNGERARLAPGVRDVAHEFDCTWRAADGTVARAWVFAPPVTRPQARSLVRAAVGPGCRRTGGPAYGAPSVATRCRIPDGVRRAHVGLFGDAWLSCTLATTRPEPADLAERTGRWCVAVAQAAAAG